MERLTKYFSDWAHGAEGVSCKALTGSYCRGTFEATAIVDRLAAIEDILGDDYNLNRIRELIEADRAGRCVVLPVEVGQKIYKIHLHDILELTVEHIICWSSGRWVVKAHSDKANIRWKEFEIGLDVFGCTVFLTRESAEAALKRERHE